MREFEECCARGELRTLLDEMKHLLQEASNTEQQLIAKEKDFEAAVAEKDAQISELNAQLGTIEEQIGTGQLIAPPPVPKTRNELEELADELERENAKTVQEKKIEEERRRLREDEEALEQQMRQMEVSMARERAMIARQATELKRLSAEIQHELDLLQRGDAGLREQMSKFQRRAQEVMTKQPTLGVQSERSAPASPEGAAGALGASPVAPPRSHESGITRGLPNIGSEPPEGSLVPQAEPGFDPLDCSVYSPAEVSPGQSFLVQVFAHRPEERHVAAQTALAHDPEAAERGFATLFEEIARNARLDFHLSVCGFLIDSPFRQLVWRGRTAYVAFPVSAPKEYRKRAAIGEVTVSRNGIPLGHIAFQICVAHATRGATVRTVRAPQKPVRYRKAFISYASKDRLEVLRRVDVLRLACDEFYQDLLDLEPGERWEQKLYQRIDECDLFILFWSAAAKKSKWVRKEVEYAHDLKRGKDHSPPRIFPVILGTPPPPKPPPQLAHMHLNDYLIYFRS